MSIAYRALPSVHRLLEDERLRPLREALPHALLVDLVRAVLDEARQQIERDASPPPFDGLVARVLERAEALQRPHLRPVINATGVIIHTNLGRAPLSDAARAAIERAARGYSNLEFDLDSGERGSRHVHVESLLCQLTGAEAALAVNNNAAAVLLVLTALAAGRKVIVSRGQAVEIGGGFRIPDVLRQSGARLVEVGTTNRTYLRDYAEAITDQTAAILRVHPSNFRVVGFTAAPTLQELVALGRERGVLVLDDLGSGCLLDTSAFGLAPEPRVQESVAAGADIVAFSGDKLLGGPQAGIIVGRRALLERVQRHPLARAVRLDKLSTAALEATLRHYQTGEALTAVPVWRMIAAQPDALRERAQRWAAALGPPAHLEEGRSTIGGGSLPGETLPTSCLAIGPFPDGAQAHAFAALLRRAVPPVIGRIERNTVLLDPRTVLPEEDEHLLQACRTALATL